MTAPLNYRHLYYFWVSAREGGLARAAARLGMAVQTVSAQVHSLERALGASLFRPAGRGLALTEAGEAALAQADRIFELGEALPARVREATERPSVRLVAGIADTLPKLVVRELLRPVLGEPDLRLVCREGSFEELLGALALHRLDIVLADRPPPANPNLRIFGHTLGASRLAWYAPRAAAARLRRGFPGSLARVGILLPTPQAAIRVPLDQWLARHGIVPRVVAEVEDSALLKTLAASGMGAFAAAELAEPKLVAQYGVRRVGPCDGVEERFYAIGTERRVNHPLVRRIMASAAAAR